MGETTFQDRMDEAIRRAGGAKVGQSNLARMVNKAFGLKLKPQNIQYLASRTPNKKTGKLAQGSRHSAQIAFVVGLMGEWLATGKPPRNAPSRKPPRTKGRATKREPITEVRTINVKVKETGEKITVELTTEALKIAQAFMDMGKEDRLAIMREVRARELKRKISADAVPDDALDHLAAPGTEAAARAERKRKAATKAAERKKPKPPSKHAQ